jgi:hypothetical protein
VGVELIRIRLTSYVTRPLELTLTLHTTAGCHQSPTPSLQLEQYLVDATSTLLPRGHGVLVQLATE